MIRAGDGMGHFLYSKEGATLVDPLAMMAYGLGVLSLNQELWKAHPGVNQPWYVDYAGAGGTFEGIRHHIDNMMV